MIIIYIIILYKFYAGGGFGCLIRAAQRATGSGPTGATSHPEPPPDPEPKKPELTREQLEKIAGNCLTAMGVKFETYFYCKNKTDIELMNIITRYNLEK